MKSSVAAKARKRAPREHLSAKEAAERVGASRQLLGKWVNQRRLHRNPDGTYPFPETAEAVERIRAEDQDKRRRGFGNEDYQTQRARLAKERADQLERENRTRRGELVELADVERLVRASLERANAVLKNVPSKYGQKLARRSRLRLPEARALLSEIVEAVRAQLRMAPTGLGRGDVAAD